jgi:hypothetical protein
MTGVLLTRVWMVNNVPIVWHMGDLKISHVDPNVVGQIIRQLEAEFGNEAPLSITRGKLQDYHGTRIDYTRRKWILQ